MTYSRRARAFARPPPRAVLATAGALAFAPARRGAALAE